MGLSSRERLKNSRSSCPKPLEVLRCGSYPHQEHESDDERCDKPELGILRLKNRQDPERQYQQQYPSNEDTNSRDYFDIRVVDVFPCLHLPELRIFGWLLPPQSVDAEENVRLEEVSHRRLWCVNDGNEIVLTNERNLLRIYGTIITLYPILHVLDGPFWCNIAGTKLKVGDDAAILN